VEPKPKLVILGCYHEIQRAAVVPQYEADQQFLRSLIPELIEQHNIQFIGEETKQGQESIAAEIATRRGIRYVNIDIPLDVQHQIKTRPSTIYNEDKRVVESIVHSDKYSKAWNLVREYHMYRTFMEQLGCDECSLLVCGRLHVTGFLNLFGNGFDIVPICVGPRVEGCCVEDTQTQV